MTTVLAWLRKPVTMPQYVVVLTMLTDLIVFIGDVRRRRT